MNAASVNAGRDDIVKRLTSQAKECPKQKFAIVGYSQGARILRMAMKEMETRSPELLSKVVAIATYGDPGARDESAPRAAPALPEVLRPRTVINCVSGDAVSWTEATQTEG
jgi:cutinase